MRSATLDPAYRDEHTIYVMGPWQGKSLTVPWSGSKPRSALSLSVKVPDDHVVAAFRQHVRSSWSDLEPIPTGTDVLSVVTRFLGYRQKKVPKSFQLICRPCEVASSGKRA
jgi:hypothetical protein